MSKIVELKASEIENVVGGYTFMAASSLYPAPTGTTAPTYQLPPTSTSMNPAPTPPAPRRH